MKVLLALTALLAFEQWLPGQTMLTPGTPVSFKLTAIDDVLLNGKNGYVIPIPAGPQILNVNVTTTPNTVQVSVYLRCGSDVGGSAEAPVFDTSGGTSGGNAYLTLAIPNGGPVNCYIALDAKTEPPSALGTGGRLTATLQPMQTGTPVTISSLGNIYLAGQPGGTKAGTLSAPSNSPAQANLAIVPGQAYSILATGSMTAPNQIGGAPPEGASVFPFGYSPPGPTTAMLGLSAVNVTQTSLIGVFVSDNVDPTKTPLGMDFGAALKLAPVIYPALQQVFYVGNGALPTGGQRVFVAPAGATRLFLASAAGGFNASGTFMAYVSTTTIPAAAPATNPVIIPAIADLLLADQPTGTGVGTKVASAMTPYSLPPQVSVTAGQTLHIRAIGTISGDSTPVAAAYGISDLPPETGLCGVFVGNTLDPTKTPARLDPLLATQTVSPLLQQAFYIGDGLTTSGGLVKNFVAPAGATRLLLGQYGGGFSSSGFDVAMVTVDSSSGPVIATGGIVNNAGFAAGPIAPGSMAAIFGSNFGPVSSPSSAPLPTTLGGTQVFFNNVPAPLVYVSPGQIVVEVPYEMSSVSQALVAVVVNGVASLGMPVTISSFAGQIFTTGTGDPVITDYNTGALVSMSSPAARGDTLVVWGTGLGLTLVDPPTGSLAPGVASTTLLPITATFKNAASGTSISAPLLYAGLAPGFIGLDQINLQIPTTAQTGTTILTLASPGLTAVTPVTIGIQ